MNHYPLWKNILVAAVVLIGGLFALPNLYDDDLAIQISAGRINQVDLALASQVETALKAAAISYKTVTLEDNKLLVRFTDAQTQLKAKAVIDSAIADDYVVAFNLAATTPSWLATLGGAPMNLGLDLRGGVHFLMEVDMNAAIQQALNGYESEFRFFLRDEKIRYKKIQVIDDGIIIALRYADSLDEADDKLTRQYNQFTVKALPDSSDSLLLKLTELALRDIRKNALQQNILTLRNRINELGVAEPTVQQQGDSRIVVQLPGVQDTAQAKKILGATATLEFRLVDTDYDAKDALNGRVPANTLLYYQRGGEPVLLKKRVMLTGDHIINAAATFDQMSGSPAVSITLDGKGAGIFSNVTRDNINKPMAVVFIESGSETREINGEIVKVRKPLAEVISVATIRDQLSKQFQITGLDSTTEARDLALLLRAGALAAPIEVVEERTVGPSLGQDNINQGFNSVMIGFALVLVFMVIWYRLFGAIANLALAINLVLIVALLSLLQATLTLPGIAGIVLTVGMAVDANVLIFERIREEMRIGNSPQSSISTGYQKAFSTIADANVTTFIAAIVLFGFGTGAIKGFAVTLMFGIITSMFTAIMGTRAVVNFIYGRQQRPTLSI